MPIYEYRCSDCHRKVSIFWRSFSAVDETKARCNHCGGARLNRLASRIRVIRGGGSKSDVPAAEGGDVDDNFMNDLGGLDENDPRQLGRFMRKMAGEAGEEMGPEFDEIVGRLEKGEDPEKIEQSMGDLLGEPPGGDMMDGGMDAPPQPESNVESAGSTDGDKSGAKTARKVVRPRRPTSVAKGKAGKSTSKKGRVKR